MDKLYTVTGTDDHGDRHTFETADQQRANDMFRQFKEDLTDVSLSELTVVRTTL